MSSILKKEKGFTLIEVVIVLAIAALVILVVLQAVGSAQKANRDSARKTEAGRMVSILEQYASNNNGLYPASSTAFDTALAAYDSTLGTKYGTSPASCPTVDSGTFKVVYASSSPYRVYTLTECLESGGSVTVQH